MAASAEPELFVPGHPASRRLAELLVPDGNITTLGSSRAYNLAERGDREAIKRASQDWQPAAWNTFETVPEVGFGVRYVGNMLSRLQLFAAYRPDPAADPIPLDPDNPEQQAAGLAAIGDAAIAEVQRLGGASGDHGHILAPMAQNIAVAGEGWLAGIPPYGTNTVEEWVVLSNDEIKVEDSRTLMLDGPNTSDGVELPEDTLFSRQWRRHPRWRNKADSAMRALLETCEELQLLSRAIRAGATQRLNAGILLVPDSLILAQRPIASEDQIGDPQQDRFLMKLTEAMSLPVSNPNHATALVPLVLRGNTEALKEFRHLTIARPFEAEQMKQREELRRTIAAGMDLPNEILLGMNDANHWTAWLIDEQTYKAHLDPLALLMCAALTKDVLHHALRAKGFDPTDPQILIWRDPSDLIADPDEWNRALDAHRQIVISDEALRRKGRFTEDDAPTPEEYAARASAGNPFGPAALPPAPSDGPPGDREDVEPGPPAPEDSVDEAAAVTPLTAATTARRRGPDLDRLARRLAEIDRSLRARVQAEADRIIARALEVSGSRVRRYLGGRAPSSRVIDEQTRARWLQIRAAVKELPSRRICPSLGADTIHALGLTEEDLIDDGIGTLGVTQDSDDEPTLASFWLTATTRAYAESRRIVQYELGQDLDDDDTAALEARQERAIAAGFAVLSAAVASTIRERLFTPQPIVPDRGEFTLEATIRAGAVRDALAVAGGAPSAQPDSQTGSPSGGIATGEETSTMLAQFFGVTTGGGRWVYGDASSRTRPFEPHELLDQVDFTDWDDPVLANTEAWPPTAYYFPGDHDYCQCDYIPALELGAEVGADIG